MKLQRELTFFDILCLGVNSIVGSGIYLFPGILAAQLGPASIMVFPLTGLILIPIALSYAYLAARYETTGGPYLYATDAFGAWAGYAVGWTAWVTSVVSMAAVANAISAYLAHFWIFFDTWYGSKMTAVSVLAGLGVLNYRGVKPAAWTVNFFTISKLIPLLLLVAIGIPFIKLSNLAPFSPMGWAPLGSGLLLAFWACQGFENVPVPAGEARSPKRDVPLATIGSLLGASILYTVIQLVCVGIYPDLAGSSRPLAEAAGYIWPALGIFLAAGAAISTIGYTTGSALGAPRYLYALGQGSQFPQLVSRVHPKFGTPYMAIIIHNTVCIILVLALDFKKLVDFTNVVICFQFLMTSAALVKLDRAKVWVGLAGIGAVAVLAGQAKLQEILSALAVLVLGLAVSFVHQYRSSRPATQ